MFCVSLGLSACKLHARRHGKTSSRCLLIQSKVNRGSGHLSRSLSLPKQGQPWKSVMDVVIQVMLANLVYAYSMHNTISVLNNQCFYSLLRTTSTSLSSPPSLSHRPLNFQHTFLSHQSPHLPTNPHNPRLLRHFLNPTSGIPDSRGLNPVPHLLDTHERPQRN